MKALTNSGRKAFREWVASLPVTPDARLPLELLDNNTMSYGIPWSGDLPDQQFENKFEFAESLMPHVLKIESLGIDHGCWPGVWDAMALRYFDSICPKDKLGNWTPNRSEHYVYDAYWRVRHRHRIYGPVTLFRVGGESVRPFFQTKPSVLGEFEEQIGSRQELAGNTTALEVLKRLYVKNGDTSLLGGYTSSKKYVGFKSKLPTPGSLRRFAPICEQFSRTYDLAGIASNGFVALLPGEFRDWLNS